MADDLGGGGSQSARSQQLLELQGLVGSQQLDSHRLAKQLKGARHTLHMSAYSHDLLLHFLHTTPRMLPVANIVSQHISFEASICNRLTGGAEGRREGGRRGVPGPLICVLGVGSVALQAGDGPAAIAVGRGAAREGRQDQVGAVFSRD